MGTSPECRWSHTPKGSNPRRYYVLSREASRLEDEAYPYSWLPPDNPDEQAKQLSDRGPEAFPD
jgi:hypothetical protein